MEITEVRVRLVDGGAERLRAFCSITLDGDFVIRDLKVIEGVNGYFVAMPSRKLSSRCPRCSNKNYLKSRFCSECGARLGERRAPRDASGRSKLHVDVAHPINTACRERIQQVVIDAFQEEMQRSRQPGYKPVPVDEDEIEGSDYDELVAELKESSARRDERRRGDDEARAGRRPAVESEPPPEDAGDSDALKRAELFDGGLDDQEEETPPIHAVEAEKPRQERPARPPSPSRPQPRPAAPDNHAPASPPSPPRRSEPPGKSDFGAGIF